MGHRPRDLVGADARVHRRVDPRRTALAQNAFKGFDCHLELGRRLGELRDSGVLVLGSGNVVHNLEALDHGSPDQGFAWAVRFDDAARTVLQSAAPTGVAALDAHPDFDKAVPIPDHYLPLLYVAAMADERPMSLLVDGHQAGSLSMAAYTVDMPPPGADTACGQ